mmetsp:Transcript_417/g.527  ORF Transcript_417/g.527 Transcript_417/m.527 type:complete len:118 (-) Transcript_417:290-643(-)
MLPMVRFASSSNQLTSHGLVTETTNFRKPTSVVFLAPEKLVSNMRTLLAKRLPAASATEARQMEVLNSDAATPFSIQRLSTSTTFHRKALLIEDRRLIGSSESKFPSDAKLAKCHSE